MKKYLKTLNKSVAIAIAAAMTATSAPTPLLASDFTDGGDFVSESPAAEADITEEATVEADGFGDEAAVAAVPRRASVTVRQLQMQKRAEAPMRLLLLMQRHLARSDMLHLMRRIRMFLSGMRTRRQMNTRSV